VSLDFERRGVSAFTTTPSPMRPRKLEKAGRRHPAAPLLAR